MHKSSSCPNYREQAAADVGAQAIVDSPLKNAAASIKNDSDIYSEDSQDEEAVGQHSQELQQSTTNQVQDKQQPDSSSLRALNLKGKLKSGSSSTPGKMSCSMIPRFEQSVQGEPHNRFENSRFSGSHSLAQSNSQKSNIGIGNLVGQHSTGNSNSQYRVI